MKSGGPFVFPQRNGDMRDPSRFAPEDLLRRTLTRAGIVAGYTLKCRRQGCRYQREASSPESGDCPRCGMKLWVTAHPRPLRFHDLRHTAATLMLEAGADLHAVQRIMRHKSPVTTMKVYGHVQQDYLRNQLSKLKVAEGNPVEFATQVLRSSASLKKTPGIFEAEAEKIPGVEAGGADGTRKRLTLCP